MEMWKCHTHTKHVPIPDEDSQVFWEGCRRGRLLIQRCDACGMFRFPPSPVCPGCLASLTTWQDDPGLGIVQTYCVYHSDLAGPAWRADLPYIVAVIRLEHSGINMLSNLVCDTANAVQIGLRVQVIFEPMSEHITVPKFVPYVRHFPAV